MQKLIVNLILILVAGSFVGCQISVFSSSPTKRQKTEEPPLSDIELNSSSLSSSVNSDRSSKTPSETPSIKPSIKPIPKQIVEAVPILMYHSISNNDPDNDLMVSPTTFAAQMKHLNQAGYHTITFQDLEDWQAGKPIPQKPILLTFDDGYLDNYTAAYPVLKQYNLKATFFISINYLGDARHISWENIKEMYDSGLIQFGSHSKSHPDLTVISSAKRQEEIFQSKQIIEEKIGSEVIAFSYPAGAYNNTVIGETAAAGYKFAVTTRPGDARLEQGLLTLHRVRIHGYYTADDFAKLLP